jgi:hypothetical protein
MDRKESVERLAVHASLGLHLIVKWMSERTDVPADLKHRLATHLMAVDSSLADLGHSALRSEFETTENRLR